VHAAPSVVPAFLAPCARTACTAAAFWASRRGGPICRLGLWPQWRCTGRLPSYRDLRLDGGRLWSGPLAGAIAQWAIPGHRRSIRAASSNIWRRAPGPSACTRLGAQSACVSSLLVTFGLRRPAAPCSRVSMGLFHGFAHTTQWGLRRLDAISASAGLPKPSPSNPIRASP